MIIMILRKIRHIFQGVFDLKGLNFLYSKDLLKNMVPVFILIIFLPLFYGIFNFSKNGNNILTSENRMTVKKPEFSFNSIFPFFKKYEKYYIDKFPFRSGIIKKFNKLKYCMFKISPVGDVLIGKDGWLFLKRENGIGLLKSYLSKNSINKQDFRKLEEEILRRQNYAKKLGCEYLLVISPDKWSVYPEMMPEGLNREPAMLLKKDFSSRLGESGINLVTGLTNWLVRAKKRGRLYKKTDTHWNELGAFFAYRRLIRKLSILLKEKIQPLVLKKFNIKKIVPKEPGDLERILSLNSIFESPKIIILIPGENNRGLFSSISPGKNGLPSVILSKKGELSPLLFIHDSFGEYLEKFISVHFKKTYLTTNRMDLYKIELLKELGIKYIIEQVVERHIFTRGYKVFK